MEGGWCAPPPECPSGGRGHSLQDPTSLAHSQVALKNLWPSQHWWGPPPQDEEGCPGRDTGGYRHKASTQGHRPQQGSGLGIGRRGLGADVSRCRWPWRTGCPRPRTAHHDGCLHHVPGQIPTWLQREVQWPSACAPQGLTCDHPYFIELQAWQTKTVSAAKIRKQPVPLICPKFSFTGKDWWLGMVTVIRKMTKLDQFKGMDFLIPTVNKDFNGLIARPSTPDRALRWLKDALVRQGVTRTLVDPLTWHSFRVFIPDCAFQLGIPRTQRQYLGNWLTESTADVYTREKRNVVVSIWDKVGSRVHSLNMGPGRLRREDLDHPDWEDKVEQVEDLDEPVPLARESPQGTSPQKSTPGSEGSWEQVGSLLPDPPSGTGFVKRQLFKVPAHGGLRVIVSTTKTSGTGQYRLHLINQEGVAVGCGWRPNTSNIEDILPEDYHRDPLSYGKCARCFKHHEFPEDWGMDSRAVDDAQVDSSSSVDSDSETDDSVDTGSEAEGVCLKTITSGRPTSLPGAAGPVDGAFGHPVILRKWRVWQAGLRKWRAFFWSAKVEADPNFWLRSQREKPGQTSANSLREKEASGPRELDLEFVLVLKCVGIFSHLHTFVSCIELAVARHMFGMLNQNVHWTFWLKTGSDPAFCENPPSPP